MNEPYVSIPTSFGIFKRKSKPHDFGKAIYIREWQLEIPFKEQSVIYCLDKRFPELKTVSITEDSITFSNGLVIHFDIIDRNEKFRNEN